MRNAALLALGLVVVSCGARQKPVTASDIPIKRVVLYQNGVGYFERHGKLDGDVLTLQARPWQINDLLKSLTVIDTSKGRAVSISLPLEKSGAKKLSELPKQVRDASGLLDVLRVFRGAKVVVRGGSGTIRGRVVGVENLNEGAKDKESKPDWRLTLKSDGGGLLVYPVAKVKEISLMDRTLAVGLDQALDVSLDAGNWKPVELKVRLAGNAEHKIVASYIVEMPRWKPAYRLVLGKDGKTPLLQGWAVVDNVSGEDWNNVKLSLVAGNPISFTYDLHSPQFTRRVDLSPRGRTTALAPVIEKPGFAQSDRLQSAVAGKRAAPKARPRRKESRKKRFSGRGDAPMEEPATEEESDFGDDDFDNEALDEALEEQAPTKVSGADVGALFRYDLKDRVTVADRSSTLVAIVNSRVPGQEVVLFRPELTRGMAETNPYRAVMFKNESGFSLEKGPIAIYSRGTFVGEGFLDRMAKNTTNFISYSIDANVTMARKQDRKDEGLRLMKIIDGMLVSEVLSVERSIFKIKNRHSEAVTAFVKTTKRTGWKLRNQPKGTVDNTNAFLVPKEIPANGEAELVVEWVRPVVRRVAIDTSLSTSLLKAYIAGGQAPAAVRPQIQKILNLKREVTEIDAETRRLRKQHSTLSADQNRVRQNLNLLRKTKGNRALMTQLTKKLAALELELGKHSGRLVKLSEKRASMQRQMRALIRTITISGK